MAGPTPALGQPDAKAQAEAKLAEMARLLQKKAYQEALAPLREALALFPSPKLHFNFGMIYKQLGRPVDALESLERYLGETEKPERGAEARSAIRDLKRLVGTLRIRCDTPGAEIAVDGEVKGAFPLDTLEKTVYLAPGSHELLVGKPGTPGVHRSTVQIAAGRTEQVDARLSQARDERQAQAAAGLAEPPAEPRGGGGAIHVAEDRPAIGARQTGPARSVRVPALSLATAGGALASLGFGVVKHLQAADRARTFSDYRGPSGGPAPICGEEDLDRGGPGCSQLYGDARSALRWAFVGYGLAAALTAGSILLYVTRANASGEPGATALACLPLAAQRGLACAMRF
jgi:hypothetical protein